MKLNLQQIRSVTQGAEQILEEKGSIRFYRFTEEELALYKARPDYYPMAVSTAGVQLEFRTDAAELYLRVTATEGKLYHKYFAFDILVNEKLVGQLKNYAGEPENGHYDEVPVGEGPFSGCFALGEGEKTVRIVFPWSVNVGLEELRLEDATLLVPVEKRRKLLLYGDSISQGTCSLYPSQTYPALITQWLNADAVNKAVGSEFYYPELARCKGRLCPDVITVAYGINDWYHLNREEFTDRCRKFWAAICENYPNAKKFALTPIYYLAITQCGERPFGPLEDVGELIRQITGEFSGITVIDCMDFVSRETADFGDLYVHPNHIGFRKYFQNLSRELRKYL